MRFDGLSSLCRHLVILSCVILSEVEGLVRQCIKKNTKLLIINHLINVNQ